MTSREYKSGPISDHDCKVNSALDYCNQFEFSYGRGLPPWFGSLEIETIRRFALYADYDFEQDGWKFALTADPSGSISPWYYFASKSILSKEEKQIIESIRFKEFQILDGICQALIVLLALSLRRLKSKNKQLLAEFRYDESIFRKYKGFNVKTRP